MAVICLLGHYLADAANLGCQVNATAVCQAEDYYTNFQTPGENVPNIQGLHAGFDLPPLLSTAVNLALPLAVVVLILPRVAIKPPILSPPPQ